mmetsp:Transcript_38965/g.125166  ORF Transcript_38965/g.125166 Transcript_38965/m.125166 type:complete len:209 (-) Transcript_38965:490-1116(-)
MLHDSSNTGEAHVRRHWAGPAPGNCNPRMLHEGKFKLPSRPRHMPGDPSRPPSGMSCVTLAARNRRWSSERRAFDIVGRRDGEGIEDFLTLSASESRLVQRLGEVRKQRALAERCADVLGPPALGEVSEARRRQSSRPRGARRRSPARRCGAPAAHTRPRSSARESEVQAIPEVSAPASHSAKNSRVSIRGARTSPPSPQTSAWQRRP